jgi:phenylalanyl-tRNA synthetase beta chain
LRDFVEFSLPTTQLAERLTMAGIEVEAVEAVGALNDKVVIGTIIAVHSHSASSSTHFVDLDVGGGKRLQAISTAPNLAKVAKGDKVAVALPSATILGPDETFELRRVEATTVRGVRSEAVILSDRELGVGPDHIGARLLNVDLEPGRRIRDVLPREPTWEADEIITLSILANIARCQSIRGTAREVAAITGGAFSSHIDCASVNFAKRPLQTSSFDRELCRRFTDVLIEGVTVNHSPRWICRRLVLAGVTPINNIVDIANYVMLEVGQPMHTYDADHLPKQPLGVRRSIRGERLHVLTQPDDVEPLVLDPGIPVVTSNDVPVAVAGVVGSTKTAVRDTTQRVLLESANFDFISIRKSQSALKIFTEASARFSRGVDPQLTTDAIRRFIHLIVQNNESARVGRSHDYSLGVEDVERTIVLGISEANASLGTSISPMEMSALLERVGISNKLDQKSNSIIASISSDREDVTIPSDLLEEIARLYGYERLPGTMPLEPIPGHPRNNHRHLREQARDALVMAGLQEVMTYSLTSPDRERALLASEDKPIAEPPYVRILNPISSERTVMRRSLLPELLLCVQRNLRHSLGCHFFEIGQVFLPEGPTTTTLLPYEEYRVAIAMSGAAEPGSVHHQSARNADYFDAAEAVQFLFRHLHIDDVSFRPARHPAFHPGICAEVIGSAKVYGQIGEIHPLVARAFGLEGHRVLAVDLSLEMIIADAVRFFGVSEILRQPSIQSDISVAVTEDMLAGRLREIVRNAAGPLLQDVEIFDIYRGAGVPDGYKAVGLRLTLNAGERTLTTAEEREIFDRVVKQLRMEVGAELRT